MSKSTRETNGRISGGGNLLSLWGLLGDSRLLLGIMFGWKACEYAYSTWKYHKSSDIKDAKDGGCPSEPRHIQVSCFHNYVLEAICMPSEQYRCIFGLKDRLNEIENILKDMREENRRLKEAVGGNTPCDISTGLPSQDGPDGIINCFSAEEMRGTARAAFSPGLLPRKNIERNGEISWESYALMEELELAKLREQNLKVCIFLNLRGIPCTKG